MPKLEQPKRALKDKSLKSIKPAAPGKRRLVYDSVVPNFAVRVTPRGHKSYVLITRFPGKHPTPRLLGRVGVISLAQARDKARAWLSMLSRGIDPAVEAERERQAAARKQACTFAAVVEDFVADKLSGERRGRETERDIRKEFLPRWKSRPITDISDLDILMLINQKKKTAPAMARNLLGIARRLFQWAIDQRVYGLMASPCQGLKPAKIVGEKPVGQRTLSDDELFALWRAARRMGYPFGAAYRVLCLTALRLNEAVGASWPEFDLKNRLWVIPAVRMKGRDTKARPHAVPITDDLFTILDGLPRFKRGDHAFTTTFGEKACSISNKVKLRVDARMLRTLRALARQRGDDPTKVEKLAPWVNHDIRRTIRTRLSRLPIAEEVREAVLAHARVGIARVYDAHDYLDEKREALNLWATKLRAIVEPPPPDNKVVQLRQA
jgi:integrase